MSTNDILTPQQKAGQTNAARKQKKKEAQTELLNDQRRALEILRKIRDDESADQLSRIHAIELIAKLT